MTSDPRAPILDREIPLTGPVGRRAGIRALLVPLVILIFVLPVFLHPPFAHAIREWLARSGLLGPWTLPRAVFAALGGLLIGFSITAIHELGHLVVGVSVGFRCRSIFVGPLQV